MSPTSTTPPTTPAAYLAGRLLLAMPGMPDPRFDGAAIALCVHDEHGALGIGLDSELDGVGLHELLVDLDIEPGIAPDCAVLIGGPVEPNRGFVVHSPDWTSEATLEVGPWSLTASRDILTAIAEGHGPAQWLVALGYAGWGPGQLDGEMSHHGWHAAEGRPPILFETPVEARWSAAWKAEGIDPALLANFSGRV
jgi:putative transcriptional regulator